MRLGLAIALIVVSCTRAPAPTVAAECGVAIEQLDALLRPGATLVFGEMHGTREIPRFVGAVACEAARRGPVVLGLEVPDAPTLLAFLRSDGGPVAKQAMLATPFWQDEYQDGRRSVAMFELLDQVRRWRQQGLPIELLAFDGEAHDEMTRDHVMAGHVLAKRKERPADTFVLLMGNLHARKTLGTPWGDLTYAWLASMLPSSALTFNTRAPRGTAWLCHSFQPEQCGADIYAGNAGATGRPGVELKSNDRGAYDGLFDVASLTASPPAAFPERARGLTGRIAELVKGRNPVFVRALEAFKRKDFLSCADELTAIAEPTADHLYLRARCLASARRIDDAFGALGAALDAGFIAPKTLQRDEALGPLRGDARWPTP